MDTKRGLLARDSASAWFVLKRFAKSRLLAIRSRTGEGEVEVDEGKGEEGMGEEGKGREGKGREG